MSSGRTRIAVHKGLLNENLKDRGHSESLEEDGRIALNSIT
jgi:hypothetical protein